MNITVTCAKCGAGLFQTTTQETMVEGRSIELQIQLHSCEPPRACRACSGNGVVRGPSGEGYDWVKCKACKGRGAA